MNKAIVTKFTIATEQGMNTLLYLTQTIAKEKFSDMVLQPELNNYLSANFSEQVLYAEVNSMSNQWLVVYENEEPAGFARITSKGNRPETLAYKRAIRIADFGLLKAYINPEARQSLFDKCLAVCKSYEAIWINEYKDNPLINFFEDEGFTKTDGSSIMDELPLPSVCLIK